jgi:hypothetical protein
MKPSEVFGLAVRLIGLVASLYGFLCLVDALCIAASFVMSQVGAFRPSDNDFVHPGGLGLFLLLLGIGLLRYPEDVVRFTYGKDTPSDQKSWRLDAANAVKYPRD